MYADDTEAHFSHNDLALAQAKINNDLMNVDQRLSQNRMIANVKKTKSLLIASRPAIKKAERICVRLSNKTVEQLEQFGYLGFVLVIVCRGNHILQNHAKGLTQDLVC